MFVTIEIKSGNLNGQRKDLAPGHSVIIGRSQRADLTLPDDNYLSGMHLLLECREDGCHARDLSSTNGTWVNRQRISDAKLRDGDIIIIGHTVLRIWIRSHQDERSEPKPTQPPIRTVHFGPSHADSVSESGVKKSIRQRFSREDLQRLFKEEATEHSSHDALMPPFSPTPPPAPA